MKTPNPTAARQKQSQERRRHQTQASSGQDNQGEGNRDAARRFNQDEQRFVQSGEVDDAARRAAPRSQEEADEMARAEQKGRQKLKEEDPTVPGANAKPAKKGAP